VSPRRRHVPPLSELPPFFKDTGDLRAVIETPKGSRNKFDYDPVCDCMELAKSLPEGMVFPYDFGFIPSTLGEDGDPLDVLVLLDAPAIPGCIVRARAIGVIEARQKEEGGDWIRNDRLLASALHSHSHEGIKTLSDMRPHELKDLKGFFVDYNRLYDRKFEPLGDHGPKRAEKLIKAGMAAFTKQHRKKR